MTLEDQDEDIFVCFKESPAYKGYVSDCLPSFDSHVLHAPSLMLVESTAVFDDRFPLG